MDKTNENYHNIQVNCILTKNADKNPSTIFPHFEISFLLFLFCRNPESLNLPPTVVPDNWEVPHSCLKVGRVLGSGAFGQVLKGRVSKSVILHRKLRIPRDTKMDGTYISVAVKMLKGLF